MGCCDCLCDVVMPLSLQALYYIQSVRCGRAPTCTFRVTFTLRKREAKPKPVEPAHCYVKVMQRLPSPFNQNHDKQLSVSFFCLFSLLVASQTTNLYQIKKLPSIKRFPCLWTDVKWFSAGLGMVAEAYKEGVGFRRWKKKQNQLITQSCLYRMMTCHVSPLFKDVWWIEGGGGAFHFLTL